MSAIKMACHHLRPDIPVVAPSVERLEREPAVELAVVLAEREPVHLALGHLEPDRSELGHLPVVGQVDSSG